MNVICITGNLGKDAELKAMQDGTPVLKFSVADSQGRDKPAIWWSADLFGKRAETLAQYLKKGQQVTVTGTLSEREYEGKKYQTIRVNDVALQGGRPDGPRQQAPQPASKPAQGGFADMADDIPFIDPLHRRAMTLVM
ncbi:MAG: single-stranded DNA-binding protein [Brachymonas sp.]